MPVLGKLCEGLGFWVIFVSADSALPFAQEVKLVRRHKRTSLFFLHKNHLFGGKCLLYRDFKGSQNGRQF
jgi:hypothetical protein